MLSSLINIILTNQPWQKAFCCSWVLCILLTPMCRAASRSTTNPSDSDIPQWVQASVRLDYQPPDSVLQLGVPVKSQMAGKEVHAYQMTLAQGQYVCVVVEQLGIDVSVRILGPDKKSLIEMDSPNGLRGTESVSIVAQVPGVYTLELSSDKSMPPGAYEVIIKDLREPTADDLKRVAADMAFAEAQRLQFQGAAFRNQAIEKHKEAAALRRELGDFHGEAYSFCNIGRIYKALGKTAESLDYLGRASALMQANGDKSGQSFMLNETGSVYRDLGNRLSALEVYEHALTLRREALDQWGQAQILNNIGFIYAKMGYQKKALETYYQALPLWRTVQDRYKEANTLNNIDGSLDELGELTLALENLKQVLNFSQQAGEQRLTALVHNNIGKIYDTWAESQSALDEYNEALQLFQTLEDHGGEVLVLDNIAMVYAGLGDTQRALDILNKALAICETLNDPGNKVATLTNIGYVYGLQGSYREALEVFERAQPLGQQINDRKSVAYCKVSAGMAYTSLGEPQKALNYFQQALEIQKDLGDRRGQAITLDKMGQAYALTGESTNALDSYQQALTQWVGIGDRQGQASSLFGIATLERNQRHWLAARDKIDEAISIIESLRTKMTSHQLRLNYLSAKNDYYGLYIDIRMQLYAQDRSEANVTAALHASEQARARNLLDLLTEAHAEVRQGIDQTLLDRERQLERELNVHSASFLRLRNQKREADAAVVEEKLNGLIDEYQKLQTKIRTTSKSYAALKQPQPLEAKEIQQQLSDDNTVLLEYALGEQRSYLWVVTRTAIESYTLPSRAEIEKAALALRDLLTVYEPPKPEEDRLKYIEKLKQSGTQYKQRASEFSQMILGPAAARLGTKRLVIVPDGALQFIPFEALPEPVPASVGTTQRGSARPVADASNQRLLVQKNEITYLPSASTVALIRNSPHTPTNKTVAVIADPVFSADDKRILAANKKPVSQSTGQLQADKLGRALRDIGDSGDGYNLTRLPHTLEEAEGMMAVVPAGSGMMAVSFDANRAQAMNPELGKYKVVHFATHGLLDDKHPELSGIVLSMVNEKGEPQDGFLQLHDIYNLHLPVDLVVLSACRTGIGKQVRGEGLIGLTRGFMYAGAAGVVASLWKVDDEATAAVMERFYLHLIKERMSAAAAMRAAKVDIMRAREQWRAPYYWAGFILQGDWK
jgi:CHAT domain-containing protein